jgi:hypothetical protein
MNAIEELLKHVDMLDKEAHELAADLDLARAWRMRVICEQIRDILNTLILKMSAD